MTHRVERIGDATLYLGDCRDVLHHSAQCDALITDPVWPNCPPGLLPGADDPAALFWSAISLCSNVARAVIVMRHDSDPGFLEAIPRRILPFARAVILPYVMPGYIGRYLGGDEIAYCFGEPIPSRDGQRVIPGRAPSVQPSNRAANGHPCSRALDHFRFLVRWWSEPHESVLDPFMGSGTTGVACAMLGRKFVGVELMPEYFEIACERISDAYRQSDMFIERPKPAKQEALL